MAKGPTSHQKATSESAEAYRKISAELDADLIFMNCGMDRQCHFQVIDEIEEHRTKANALVTLVTSGGTAEAAFRVARCLQQNYEQYSLFIPGWCKSAGTLIAVGAHTLYFSDHGELGPLDVQMSKKDELWEYTSGLDLEYAIRSLQKTAFDMFEHFLLKIVAYSGARITFKTAAEIATNLTAPYISKISEQIAPLSIGETVRLMTIARDYGRRLNEPYENLRGDDALENLVSGYSSHDFVIDLKEASTLFRRIEIASPALKKLEKLLGADALLPYEALGHEETVTFLPSEGATRASSKRDNHTNANTRTDSHDAKAANTPDAEGGPGAGPGSDATDTEAATGAPDAGSNIPRGTEKSGDAGGSDSLAAA